MTRIAIDAMGTENGISPVIDGLISASGTSKFKVILVGDENVIKPALPATGLDISDVDILHTCDVIDMSDQAGNANKRKDSSIFKAIQLVKDGLADSCLSAGHSGATMSIATLQIGRISGVSRPAICTFMPTVGSTPSIVLDVGANADCKPNFLVDFAIMGYCYSKLMLGIEHPRVGLLANGEEDSKGSELTKEALKILRSYPFFKGNVEGGDIFNASTDVIVCDGFTGNIVLKASEGIASSVSVILNREVRKSVVSVLGALLMKRAFNALKMKVDYAEYGGAPLLGIKKPVIVSHGKSNGRAIECAIYRAIKSHEVDICSRMAQAFVDMNVAG